MATGSNPSRFDELTILLYEQNQFVIKYDLASMAAAAESLGLPSPARKVVLVGGTNGKGTTCASLNAYAMSAGLRIGFYSSPHLIDLRERIRVNAAVISEPDFCRALEPILRRFSGREGPSEAPRALSYFELLTLTAWSYFAEQELDLAIFEVGLGGRLDATNTLDPDLSIITSVALDHQDYLGDTTAAIASEKAAICRPGRPLITHRYAGGFEHIKAASALHGPRLLTVEEGAGPSEWNQALGWAGFRTLYPQFATQAVHDDGLARVRWPGRRQVWDDAKGRRFYLDGAHNPHAIAATCDWLQSLTSQPIDIVFGLSGKREALPLLKSLAPLVGRLIVTECISAPAIPAHEIAELARGLGILTEVSATPAQALATVSSAAVVGSLYLVGDVLAALGIQVEDLSIYAEA